jgi:hypothetical protein
MEDGSTAEVGLIGREGVVGSFHVLGPAKVATSCFIQLEATSLRIPFPALVHAFRSNEEIRDRILEFVQEQAISLSQLAGCNRLHESEERLARWLLMAQDRTGTDVLDFTQEFLGRMLGARRTTVTVIAGVLQRSGLIEYRRGKVTILNRESLPSFLWRSFTKLTNRRTLPDPTFSLRRQTAVHRSFAKKTGSVSTFCSFLNYRRERKASTNSRACRQRFILAGASRL